MFNSTCRTTRSVLCLDMDNFANFCLEHGLEIDLASIYVRVALILDNWERPDLALSFGDIAALPPQVKKYQLRRMLSRHHVRHEDIPYAGYKNSADIRMAVAITAMVHECPEIDTYILVSGDRDFVPVADYLRSRGRRVIGVGPSLSRVNPDYVSACDQFIFVVNDELIDVPAIASSDQLPAIANTPAPLGDAGPVLDVECLLAAINSVQAEGKICRASEVATRMKVLYPQFDVKAVGGFKRFCLEQIESTGKVQIVNPDLANFILQVQLSVPTDRPFNAPELEATAAESRVVAEDVQYP